MRIAAFFRFFKCLFLAAFLLAPAWPVLAGETTVTYDGEVGLPPGPPWQFQDIPFNSTSPVWANNSMVQLDTLSESDIQAGYFSPSILPPGTAITMDRHRGFTVWVDAHVVSEFHNNNDRAGFSIIVLSNDLWGIELGFWTGQVWAQEFMVDYPEYQFVHSEGAAVNTTTGVKRYAIYVRDYWYILFADKVPTMFGYLRDYSSFGPPYDTPNFIFFGDNTSSARAKAGVARVAVSLHVMADLNDDAEAGLADVIIAEQVFGGLHPTDFDPDWAHAGGDIDGYFKVTRHEMLHALREAVLEP